MNIEYGFLPKAEGVSHSSSFAYAATFGANYFFMHRLSGPFVGARIGYNSASYNSMNSAYRGHYVEVETNVHFVSVPLNIGYALATPNKNWAITPYAGMDFNFCVAGKTKIKNRAGGETNEKKGNVKKKMAIDARVGVVLRLYGFDIFASYIMPVNNAQKSYFGEDSYMAVGIGFGF